MPDPSHNSTMKFVHFLADNWVYLPLDVQIEVLGRVALKRLKRMSRGRRVAILIAAALAIITFIAVASLILGATSPALRLALYALLLGLFIGALIAWAASR